MLPISPPFHFFLFGFLLSTCLSPTVGVNLSGNCLLQHLYQRRSRASLWPLIDLPVAPHMLPLPAPSDFLLPIAGAARLTAFPRPRLLCYPQDCKEHSIRSSRVILHENKDATPNSKPEVKAEMGGGETQHVAVQMEEPQ